MSVRPVEPRRRVSQLRKLLAFLHRDFLEASSYKLSFLYSLGGVIFSSATFFFVAKLVSPETPALQAYGGDYFAFAVVGIAFSGLLGIFQDGLPSVIRGAQVAGTLEALLVTQTSVASILVGSSLYSFVFAILRTVVHFGVAAILFGLTFGRISWAGAAAILLLTVLCYLSLGILSASFILVYKLGNPITWIFGSVSGLLGGMLFPVAVLPPAVRWLSSLLPITYTLEGMRRCLLGSAGFADVLPQVLALAVFGVLLLPLSLVAFRLALRKAKRDGTLTHY